MNVREINKNSPEYTANTFPVLKRYWVTIERKWLDNNFNHTFTSAREAYEPKIAAIMMLNRVIDFDARHAVFQKGSADANNYGITTVELDENWRP